MSATEFNDITMKVIDAGYEDDIIWQRELKPCASANDFFGETCWVILNSGMKEQIARKIWNRVQDAWDFGIDIKTVFNHEGKVKALNYVRENAYELFEKYEAAVDKIGFLLTIPYIGKITCWHLAKNLGHDVVKPDRHLVRVAQKYSTTPDELCEKISQQTGERKCVVDIIIWRACNLGIL